MKIIPFYYNDNDDLCSNTYLIVDSQNRCIVIDPSKNNDSIVNFIKKNQLNLVGILLTHGHIDHFRGIKYLIDNFIVETYISFEDSFFLKDSELNCSKFLGEEIEYDIKLKSLSDKEIITLLDEGIVALATPYHTVGSMCYYIKSIGALFSGDSLFKGTIGRSDLPTGNRKEIFNSLNKIFSLNPETKVYPGHGATTYLKNETDIIKFVKGL